MPLSPGGDCRRASRAGQIRATGASYGSTHIVEDHVLQYQASSRGRGRTWRPDSINEHRAATDSAVDDVHGANLLSS